MRSPSRTLLITGAMLLTGAVGVKSAAGSSSAGSLVQPLENRILTPIGAPTAPIRLKVPAVQNNTSTSALPALPITSWITFQDFMRLTEKENLALAAERYNVPIAEAHLTTASVYPDPSFQAGYAGDVSGNRQATTYAGALSETIVLGARLRAGVQAARANVGASRAGLADYLRTLRGQAADAFIDALTGLLKFNRDLKSLERARQLVEFDQNSPNGQISQDALLRSRIAELETHSNLADAQSALHETLGSLMVLMGTSRRDSLIGPVGNLERRARTFSVEELVEKAVTSRSDVVAAQFDLDGARAGYRQAKAMRIPDLTLAGNYAHLTRITNPIDPAPAWDSAGVTFSIPIPFSDFNGGAVQAAYYQQLQAEKSLQAIRLQAEVDVRTAYEQYVLSVEEAESFASELLIDSNQLYKKQLFRLGKGQVTLTDVLDTHAALDQLYTDYYNALSNRAKALVALEQAAGLWDVDF